MIRWGEGPPHCSPHELREFSPLWGGLCSHKGECGQEKQAVRCFWGEIFAFFALECWTQQRHCRVQRSSQAVCCPPLGWDREGAAGAGEWGRMRGNVVIAAPGTISMLCSPPEGQPFVVFTALTNLSKATPFHLQLSSDLFHCCAKHPTRAGLTQNWRVPRGAVCQWKILMEPYQNDLLRQQKA